MRRKGERVKSKKAKMKIKRKLFAFFLCFLMHMGVFGSYVFAASEDIQKADGGSLVLAVNPYGNARDSLDTLQWFPYSEGNYCLFLPADCDPSRLTVYFDAADDVYVDGARLENGAVTDAFANRSVCLVSCGDSTYTLTILASDNIPAVFICTKSGSLDAVHADKSVQESGDIRIYENGRKTVDTAIKAIKGRGNATWEHPKKPYTIKFGQKISLFGMDKAKKWTLLAPYLYDNGLMKNAIVFDLGQEIGLDETSSCQFVDLYINSEYLGTYLICESVEIADGRLEINDLEKASEKANPGTTLSDFAVMGINSGYVPGSRKWVDIPNEADNITGGYLLEFDYLYRYRDEISGFISDIGQPIVIRSPEYASKAQVDYISAYWQEAEDALYAESGCNAKGISYTDYFDLRSLAKCYIIHELSKNVDCGITSFFFYKDADSKRFYSEPLWDFDHAMGCHTALADGQLTIYEPDTWYASILRRTVIDSECKDYCTFFAQCWSKANFRQAVIEEWKSFAPVLGSRKLAEYQRLRDSLAPSAVMNTIRWKLSEGTDPELAEQYFRSLADQTIDFLFARKNALDKGFSESGATVVYSENGGTGPHLFDSTIYRIGEQATAKDNTLSYDGHVFVGWNTKADGSGLPILPQSTFTVTDNYMTLYAQWAESDTEHR